MAKSSTITLGSGQQMPSFGFGTWQVPQDGAVAAVKAAIRAGFRLIDCATTYMNEREVGKAITECIEEGAVKREELFIVGKLWNTHHETDRVAEGCASSLADLKCGYFDLYLIHWPISWEYPQEVPPAGEAWPEDLYYPESECFGSKVIEFPLTETWKAMEKLVSSGVAKSIGVCNCSVEEVDQILQFKDLAVKPSVNQVECRPGFAQTALRAAMKERGIVVQAHSPFAAPDGQRSLGDERLVQIAAKEAGGVSVPELLIKWNLTAGNAVIVKSVTDERIQANAAVSSAPLPEAAVAALAAYSADNNERALNPQTFRAEPALFFVD